MMNKTILKDLLYNLHSTSGASDEYCHGLVVGCVSTLMAGGLSFTEALTYVGNCAPEHVAKNRWPIAWQEDAMKYAYRNRGHQ